MRVIARGAAVVVLFVALGVGMPTAKADVNVSVTLTGPIEEILPILQLLQDLGVGSEAYSEDPLRLRVQSDYEGAAEPQQPVGEAQPDPAPEEPPAEPEAPEEPAAPAIGFGEVNVTPHPLTAGETGLIEARLADPENQVDTVSVTADGQSFDLYDNGTQGDKTAADGIWSFEAPVPPDAAPGEYTLTITAHDDFGDVVQMDAGDGTQPMQTTKTIQIKAAE